MKKQILKRLTILTLLATLLVPAASVAASDGNSYQYDGYVYDSWGEVQEGPAMFELETIINNGNMSDYVLAGIDDVTTSEDERIFIADKAEGRVNVFDGEGNFLKTLKVLRDYNTGSIAVDADGNQIRLSSPSGLYYHEKNSELYIADAGTKSVYILDGESYALKRIIGQPENLTGDTEYVPYKVTVDFADRIYIIVKSSHEGIVELNEDGSFSRYYGVNEPKTNLVEFFWKSIATDVQKEKMGKSYAPAFTNLTTDSEGFIYAVTNDSEASAMVFRLNSKGENVIRSLYSPIVGELTSKKKDSSFIDIAVTDYGVYACLDETLGRIYLYDYDGAMLNVFGGYGKTKGQFTTPTSISWLGEKLVVTDTALRCVFVLKPTDFGRVALLASREYYNGNWESATQLFKACLNYNGLYEIAYLGIGKNYLMQDKYEEAMYYFKLGNSRSYYSDAYNGYRNEQLKKHFWVVVVVFVGLITALVVSEVRYHKKNPLV